MFYDRAEEQEGALNTLTKQPGERAQGQEAYKSWIQSHMHILPHQPLSHNLHGRVASLHTYQ